MESMMACWLLNEVTRATDPMELVEIQIAVKGKLMLL